VPGEYEHSNLKNMGPSAGLPKQQQQQQKWYFLSRTAITILIKSHQSMETISPNTTAPAVSQGK
jgi:hypothetical protein